MALHTRLVPIYDGRTLLPPDEVIEYDGPPDWKMRPLDAVSRAMWELDIANPDRVVQARREFARREEWIDAEQHDTFLAMHNHKVVQKRKPGTGTSHLSNGGE